MCEAGGFSRQGDWHLSSRLRKMIISRNLIEQIKGIFADRSRVQTGVSHSKWYRPTLVKNKKVNNLPCIVSRQSWSTLLNMNCDGMNKVLIVIGSFLSSLLVIMICNRKIDGESPRITCRAHAQFINVIYKSTLQLLGNRPECLSSAAHTS